MKGMVPMAAAVAFIAGITTAALPRFEALDTDADGRISMEEASAHEGLVTVFTEADLDKDGQLTQAEYSTLR